MTLRTADACRVARISARQMHFWIKADMIVAFYRSDRTGRYLEFSDDEVRVAFVLGRLSESGISPTGRLAQAVAEHVRANGIDGEVRIGPIGLDLGTLDDPFLVTA